MKKIINTDFHSGGGVKPSGNATFPDLIKRFFESIKKKFCELSLVNSELTNNKQNLSSRINEVHCGILKHVKRYRNSLHSCGMTHFVKCVAFTLAETLVVMGIIGVVAALTIPNLNQSTGDREKIAKVKKIYSNLEDAFGRATAIYGPIDEWFSNVPASMDTLTRTGDRLTEFMKVSKNCGREKNKGCLNTTQKNMFDGGVTNPDNTTFYKFVLADGATVAIHPLGLIYVDIDGANKGATQLGKDVFAFVYYYEHDGIIETLTVPRADNMAQYIGYLTPKSQNEGNFLFATGWIIDYGNMDYLKLTSEGKCSNGTVPTDANPSCK